MMLRYVAFALVLAAAGPTDAGEWDWSLGTGSPDTRQHGRTHIVKSRPKPASRLANVAPAEKPVATAAGTGTVPELPVANPVRTIAAPGGADIPATAADDMATRDEMATKDDIATKKAAVELANAAAATSELLQGGDSAIAAGEPQAVSAAGDDGSRCVGEVRGFGVETSDEKGALEAARKDWAERVRYDHGESYLDLYSAKDLSSRCSRDAAGRAGEQAAVRCEIAARPCEAPLQEFSGTPH